VARTTSDVARPAVGRGQPPTGTDLPAPPADGRTVAGIRRAATIAVVALAAGFVVAYVVAAVLRMRYPFELEWMEGGVVDDVRRILAGHSLYVRPSTSFTPYIYTPLYYYVAAVPAKVLGVGYFPLRLVSFVASITAFGCIAALVATDTRSRVAAFVAAGLFAACFRLGGAWFDLARVDSLFLALLFGGLLVARRARSPRAAVLAAVLLAASFQTKQSALLPAIAVVVFLFRRRRALAAWYAGALVATLGTSVAVLDALSHGWYRFYVLDVPSAHRIVSDEYVAFWTHDLLLRLWPAIVLGAVGMWWTTRARADDGVPLVWFHAPVAAALVGTAYQARLHSGGYDNVLLPAYGAVAILAALGLHGARPLFEEVRARRSEATAASARSSRGVAIGAWAGIAACVLAIAQLATLTYDVGAQVPTAADRRTGDHMLAALRELPGTVYLPGHGWYLARAGKQTSAQGASLEDVMRADVRGTGRSLRREIARAIASGRWDWVVVDSAPTFSYLPRSLSRTYVRVGTLVDRHHPPLPLTGTPTGPLTVWARRDPPPPGGVPAALVPPGA
jgi:hypothetical protein